MGNEEELAKAADEQLDKDIVVPPVVPYPKPIPRKMINVNGVDHKRNEGSFIVLTYNILSDTSANTSQYNYCPPWARSWAYLRLSWLEKIVGYSADIVCLQDVQQCHLENFIAPELQNRKYEFCYKKRTNAVLEGEPSVIACCATFFKRDKFQLVKEYNMEFNKAAHACIEKLDRQDHQLAYNRLVKDNIALIVLLEPKFGRQKIDPSDKRHMISVNKQTHV